VKKALLAIGCAAILLLLSREYVTVRDRLMAQRNDIAEQWQLVDAAMQRRADLIFDLVEPIRGFSSESGQVVEKIADARGALAEDRSPQEKMAAYDRLNFAIAHLLVVVENNRRLKSGGKLKHLPDDVSNTETEVNRARQKYNEALENYNTALQLFPNNIVAALSGFRRNDAYIQTVAGQGPRM
jgi:LemA protein